MNAGALRPWTGNDLVAWSLTTALGLGLVVVGWHGTSGAVEVRHQVPWLDVGVAGVVLLGAGNAGWILRGRRAVGARRARLLPLEPGAVAAAAPVAAASETAVVAPDPSGARLVSTAAMTRYHRPDCELVVAKAAVAATRDEHVAAGRRACGVCQP